MIFDPLSPPDQERASAHFKKCLEILIALKPSFLPFSISFARIQSGALFLLF